MTSADDFVIQLALDKGVLNSAQVAAARFGVDVSRIKITATDTAKVPNTSATAASSGSDLNGMATQAACDTIRERMAECLATLHQTTPDKVIFADDKVTVGATEMDFSQAAMTCYQNRISLSATGFYKTPDLSWDRIAGKGRPFFYFGHGAAITEVVIDTLTGENRILRADILHDVGASLNPAIDKGQVKGAYVQGAGWLTTEELVWGADGKLLTRGASTYKIPTAADIPAHFHVKFWHEANPEDNIGGSKAVGEPPFMLAMSVFEALRDAVGEALGGHEPVRMDAPVTPERVLMALQKNSV